MPYNLNVSSARKESVEGRVDEHFGVARSKDGSEELIFELDSGKSLIDRMIALAKTKPPGKKLESFLKQNLDLFVETVTLGIESAVENHEGFNGRVIIESDSNVVAEKDLAQFGDNEKAWFVREYEKVLFQHFNLENSKAGSEIETMFSRYIAKNILD